MKMMKKVPTGISEFDYLLRGGFRKGKVNLICGRPGMGKSAIATKLAISMADHGYKVDFYSIERSAVTKAAIMSAWDKSWNIRKNLTCIMCNGPTYIKKLIKRSY